jgi:site-specific DNA recombinase
MTAAIYARKTTDQSAIADEAKSVTRQIAHATAYATRKGWTVPEACIFVDDGISGAEFANRPGFVRLMAALKPRPPFQVLIMSEESRLGREAIETAYALKQLITGGVRVFFYLEDRERTFDSPTDKLLMSVTAFADELERQKAGLRVYDAMRRKAAAGQVTGGRVFGYDNLEVLGANGERSHVERRINEAEAAVIRRMFELCAAGAGLTRITKTLNAEGVPAPRPQLGRPHAWATSSVRAVLRRPLYKGEVVWNRTRKRDRWGQHRQHARPEAEWMRTPAPALRIVSEDLWARAHAELAGRAKRSTRAAAVATGHRGTCSPGSRAARSAAAGSLRTRGSTGSGSCSSMAARRSGNGGQPSAVTTWSVAWSCSTQRSLPRCRTTSSGRPLSNGRSRWCSRISRPRATRTIATRSGRNSPRSMPSASGSPMRSCELLSGVVELPTRVTSPEGFDGLCTPIDRWFAEPPAA